MTMTQQQAIHIDAMEAARKCASRLRPQARMERAVSMLVTALGSYADAHRELYGSPVSDDGVIGEAHADAARAARALLNGETGRLDCGTLDALLVAMLPEDER